MKKRLSGIEMLKKLSSRNSSLPKKLKKDKQHLNMLQLSNYHCFNGKERKRIRIVKPTKIMTQIHKKILTSYLNGIKGGKFSPLI